ncbi:putative enterotoxin subunit [Yersinia kristensenii]|uniref:Enterotoxin n=2 Tax=Yersinia rochesterensis TaxID=1604335 RepID=A0A386HEE3_9GAMM|nr:enterotoxin [Yersinia rochesterensis]CNH33722.1 putative enterotoxin subunit [Yersinia kristensenii]
MILVKFIVLYLMSTLIMPNSKAKPPDIVWRVDTRDLDDVFNNGFSAAGNNNNIVEHLTGRSCHQHGGGSVSSSFISTTSNRNFAYHYAERILRGMNAQGDVNAQVYIYQIRATENMYSAGTTLEFLLRGYDHGQHHEISRILRYTPYLSEWMAHNRIEPEQIASQTAYYIYRGTIRSESIFHNARFVQTRSTANDGPFPTVFTRRPVIQWARSWMMRLGTNPMVNACFGNLEHTEFKRDTHEHRGGDNRMFMLITIL